MPNEAKLQGEQADAQDVLDALGLLGKPLKPHELTKFGRAFERQFVGHYVEREIADLLNRRRAEILMGAMVAKEQMDAEIDSEQPAPGKIGGPIFTRASFLGIGDGWQDINGIYNGAQDSWSTGSAQNWIHSGTKLLAGTAGNAIKVLENAVHVILGYVSRHASPKIESIQLTIDNKTKPIYVVDRPLSFLPGAQLKIKEFDGAIILKRNQTLKAQVFIPEAFGADMAYQQDYPELLAISFIREDALRIFDPASVPGTTNEVVTTT